VTGLLADSAGGAWTFGASVLSFAFPMLLFIFVATALYVLYTKPEYIPGHPAPGLERPVSYTPVPGPPAVSRQAPTAISREAPSPVSRETPAAVSREKPTAGTPETTAGEAAETGDAE
jgi:hypothetical protein